MVDFKGPGGGIIMANHTIKPKDNPALNHQTIMALLNLLYQWLTLSDNYEVVDSIENYEDPRKPTLWKMSIVCTNNVPGSPGDKSGN